LPINNKISVFKDGKIYTLTNEECKTEERFSDHPETWVTDCTLSLLVDEASVPTFSTNSFKKNIPGDDSTRNRYDSSFAGFKQGEVVSESPLVYLGVFEFFVQRYPSGTIIGGKPNVGGGTNYPFPFTVVTNYGTADIVYQPEDIFNEVEKSVDIGISHVSIKPVKLVDDKNIFTQSDFEFRVTYTASEKHLKQDYYILDYGY
jgi:hypothetical protein